MSPKMSPKMPLKAKADLLKRFSPLLERIPTSHGQKWQVKPAPAVITATDAGRTYRDGGNFYPGWRRYVLNNTEDQMARRKMLPPKRHRN